MALTEVTALQPINNDCISTLGADVDITNGNKAIWSNSLVLIFAETGGTNPYTLTIASKSNAEGKSKTLTKEVPANGYAVVDLLDEGFAKSGYVEISYSGSGTGKIIPVRVNRK